MILLSFKLKHPSKRKYKIDRGGACAFLVIILKLGGGEQNMESKKVLVKSLGVFNMINKG